MGGEGRQGTRGNLAMSDDEEGVQWYQDLMDAVQFRGGYGVPIPYQSSPGPQFDPKQVPIMQGPHGHYFDPRYSQRQNLHLLAGAGDQSTRGIGMEEDFLREPVRSPAWLQEEIGREQGPVTPQQMDQLYRQQQQQHELDRARAMNETMASNQPAGPSPIEALLRILST